MLKRITYSALAGITVMSLLIAGCMAPVESAPPVMEENFFAATETPFVEENPPPATVLIPVTGEALVSVSAESGGMKNRTRVAVLAGRVDAIGSEFWKVNGRHVVVSPKTNITGTIKQGDYVIVTLQKTNGGLMALAIQFDRPGPVYAEVVVDHNGDDDAADRPRAVKRTPPVQSPPASPTEEPAVKPGNQNPGNDPDKDKDKGKDKDKDKGNDKDKDKGKSKDKGDQGKDKPDKNDNGKNDKGKNDPGKSDKGKGKKDLPPSIDYRQELKDRLPTLLRLVQRTPLRTLPRLP